MCITISRRVRLVCSAIVVVPGLAAAQNPFPGRDFPTNGRGYEIWRSGPLAGLLGAGSGPTIGLVVGGALVNKFRVDSASPESAAGVGAFISTNGSWGVGAGGLLHVMQDTWRPAAGVAYYDLHYDFFGVGVAAGDRDVHIPITQKGEAAIVEALYRLYSPVYVGPRYRYAHFNWHPRHANDDPFLVALVDSSASYRASEFGATANFDTRDNEDHPRHGAYMDIYAMFAGKGLGSTANFQQFDGALTGFVALPKRQVLAMRVRGCGVSTQTPIQELCLFGITPDLRGYTGGRYRDFTMAATQAEWRVPFDGGFGAVAFAGIGSVAHDWSDILKVGLPSLGAGLRYQMPFFGGTTVGIEWAFGRSNSNAFYFRLGEAF